MKKVEVLTVVLFSVLLLFVSIFGIDSEVARRDYVETGKAEGCIFSINCDRYR